MEFDKIIKEFKKILDDLFIFKLETFNKIIQLLIECLEAGGKILIFGNGGSAAQSQHFAAELVNKFYKERQAFDVLSLTTDTSILTSVSNDISFDFIFSRQIEAFGKQGDIAMGLSTSGNSLNIIEAMKVAKEKRMRTIALTGNKGGKVSSFAEFLIDVPSTNVARIQEIHLVLLHIMAQEIENKLSYNKK
ncbi:MAG: D-sedoheptulose-7-phosphate isomerase [Candidatus Aminicenantaceae bacterium]